MNTKKLGPTPAHPNSTAYVYYFIFRGRSGNRYRRWYYVTRDARGALLKPSNMALKLDTAVELARAAGFTRIHTPYGNLRQHV
jgi:hypothetical protein